MKESVMPNDYGEHIERAITPEEKSKIISLLQFCLEGLRSSYNKEIKTDQTSKEHMGPRHRAIAEIEEALTAQKLPKSFLIVLTRYSALLKDRSSSVAKIKKKEKAVELEIDEMLGNLITPD